MPASNSVCRAPVFLIGTLACLILSAVPVARAAAAAAAAPAAPTAPKPLEYRGSLLVIGNSFQFADGSAVRFYRPNTVTDLNQGGVGGIAAVIKAFANQAGLDYTVSIETISGAALDRHLRDKKELLSRPWEHVVMAGYSTLDQNNPGNPALLVRTAKEMAELLAAQNPKVDIRLIATWPRADQTYPDAGFWHGQPIEAMALAVRAGYDQAAAGTPLIHGVIPVGESPANRGSVSALDGAGGRGQSVHLGYLVGSELPLAGLYVGLELLDGLWTGDDRAEHGTREQPGDREVVDLVAAHVGPGFQFVLDCPVAIIGPSRECGAAGAARAGDRAQDLAGHGLGGAQVRGPYAGAHAVVPAQANRHARHARAGGHPDRPQADGGRSVDAGTPRPAACRLCRGRVRHVRACASR